MNPLNPRPRGLLVVAILMILFGLAEIATGFKHNFIGIISTSQVLLSTLLGATLGACYCLAGALLLASRRKWAAALAVILLGVDILGRIGMVVAGLYPLGSFVQAFAIVVGTAIAAFFVIYILMKWKSFV